jgi:hypothetical protein
MKLIAQTPYIQRALHLELSDAINRSVIATETRCNKEGTKPQEPGFIASLAIDFSQDLFEILKKLFKGLKFSVSSVFCYQKPIADIKAPTNPEIGDILFVLINTDLAGNKQLNSLLFQVKMSKKESFTITSNEEHQLTLYTQWPRFTYRRAGKISGKTRDVSPKSVCKGAQYMLIDKQYLKSLDNYPFKFPIGCATPNKQVVLNNDLASEIIDFIAHRSGRPFSDINIQTDVWSRMIWDLIDISKSKMSRRIHSGRQSFNRYKNNEYDGLCFLMSNASNNSSIFDDIRESIPEGELRNTNGNRDNGAPSLILIKSFEVEV